MPLDMPGLSRRVVGKRHECRLTQAQLAAKIHVTQRTIAMLETGHSQGLKAKTLVALAETLEVSLDYLVYGAGQP